MGRLVKISWWNPDTKTKVPKWVDKDDLDKLSNIRIRRRSPEELEELERERDPKYQRKQKRKELEEEERKRVREKAFEKSKRKPSNKGMTDSEKSYAAAESRRIRAEKDRLELLERVKTDLLAGVEIYDLIKVNKMRPTERAEWVLQHISESNTLRFAFSTKSRAQIFTRPRMMFYYAMTFGEGWSYSRTSRQFGKDHSTVLHGAKKLVDEMPEVARKINEIYDTLHELKEIDKEDTTHECE